MGNVDRLLEALAQKLPPASGRKAVEAALRAALEALPAEKAKTGAHIRKREKKCVDQILESLREAKAAQEAQEALDRQEAASEDGSEESEAGADGPAREGVPGGSAYADV